MGALLIKEIKLASGSYRHGTEEGYKKHKCRCVNCIRWFNYEANNTHEPGYEPSESLIKAAHENADLLRRADTGTSSLAESQPPTMDLPDIISFLHEGRFNEVLIDNIRDEWAVTIKAYGDKFVGFGHKPDYAFYEAVKRYQLTKPDTGPITLTYDQTTRETSHGRALDTENEVGIEKIWEKGDLGTFSGSPEETTLEGEIVKITTRHARPEQDD